MRIATNEELLLINGSSQKLSKNQLKKLYDHGGVLTPKDWATMIDNVTTSEIIIYSPAELESLIRNNKLVVGETYYTEYYGVIDSLISNLSQTMICYGKAISNNKLSKFTFVSNSQYPNADKWLFDIEFGKIWCDDDLNEMEGYYTHSNVTVHYKINTNDDEIHRNFEGDIETSIEMIPVLMDEYGIQWKYILHIDENIIPLAYTHGSTISEFDNFNVNLDARNNKLTFTYEYDVEDSRFTGSCEFTVENVKPKLRSYYDSDYFESDVFIILKNISDENNNKMDIDYLTSMYPELYIWYDTYDQPYVPASSNAYDYCMRYCNNCIIKGNSIIALSYATNCIIDTSHIKAYNITNCEFYNSNVMDGYIQYQASGTIPNLILMRFMNNCKFINVKTAYFYENPYDVNKSFTVTQSRNVNNIDFENIQNTFSYYNCVRNINSNKIKVTSTITTEEGYDIANLN